MSASCLTWGCVMAGEGQGSQLQSLEPPIPYLLGTRGWWDAPKQS